MKKLATSIAAIAVITFGFGIAAMADKPSGTPPVHDHEDAGPLTLRSLCSDAFDSADGAPDGVSTLSEPVSVRNTIETGVNDVDGPCIIDLAGNDLSIQKATIKVTGDLTINDTSGGGLLRIIASTIDLDGFLDINLSGDITIRRNIDIIVDDDEDVGISGHGINIRDAGVTSNNSGVNNLGDLTITGTAEVSVKDNVFDGFGSVTIGPGTDIFVFDNDLNEVDGVDDIAAFGDCMSKGNVPSDPVCLPQCSDGLDNDGDTFIDFAGGDPECDDALDTKEAP